MATPPSSITTVNGRRCTRSRARTASASALSAPIAPPPIAPQLSPIAAAATPQQPSFVIFTPSPISTAAQQIPQIQTSAAEPLPTPALSTPTPNAPTDQSTIAPTTDTTSVQPTATPTSDTPVASVVNPTTTNPTTSEQITSVANVLPSPPLNAGLGQPANDLSSLVVVSSQSVVITSATSATPISTSADTISTAAPTLSSDASSFTPTLPTPTTSISESPFDNPSKQPDQTNSASSLSSLLTSIAEQPQKTTPTPLPLSSGGSSGVNSPDQGSDSSTALTQHHASGANTRGIVGGVIGGIAGFVLLGCLLFFCLRKRKSRTSTWDEKTDSGSGIIEKLNTARTGAGVFFAKIKGRKAGPVGNPYQRHTAQASVSSTYSVPSNGRGRSTSESQAAFAAPRRESMRNLSSQEGPAGSLHQKNNSVSFNYRFPGVGEDPATQNQSAELAPYADQEPPRNLQLLNPDPNSGPVTPQPAIASARLSRDAFSLLLDQIEDVPDWLRDTPSGLSQIRTQSPVSAKGFHLPFSSQHIGDDPFRDPSNVPSLPTQAVFPDQKRQSLVAYPAYNTNTNATSRNSQFTFFGEPGPSRPGTNLFTPGLFTGRTVRQSDPFDLDRPEVLGLGSVLGSKQVQASVTRQPTRGRRTSSVADGPYRL